jgi:hypothetical protein
VSDKRTVSTDALETLGTIIGPNEKRDAIHLAVIPVEAGCDLEASTHVGLIDGKAFTSSACDLALGIVDPFLTQRVKKGQHFWLVIFPRVITSLRHVWTHPELPDEVGADSGREESKRWLERFAERLFSHYDPNDGYSGGISKLDYLIKGALTGFGTDIEYGEGLSPDAEFWGHFERYTGRKIKANDRPDHFRCSC